MSSKTISMRLVEIEDASFIHSLRVNPEYNKHLSPVTGTIEDQKKWLVSYKDKEIKNEEYYYIICRKHDGKKIGTVRLYDFIGDGTSFCWGSWILNQDKTRTAALESALLVYNIAFNQLGFKQSHFDVRKENDRVIKFHLKFGAKVIGKTQQDLLFDYKCDDFFEYSKSLEKFMVSND